MAPCKAGKSIKGILRVNVPVLLHLDRESLKIFCKFRILAIETNLSHSHVEIKSVKKWKFTFSERQLYTTLPRCTTGLKTGNGGNFFESQTRAKILLVSNVGNN